MTLRLGQSSGKQRDSSCARARVVLSSKHLEVLSPLPWSFVAQEICTCWICAKLRPVPYPGCFPGSVSFQTLVQLKCFLPWLVTDLVLSKETPEIP